MDITAWRRTFRREQRLRRRVRRAAWRLKQAETEYTWAIATAKDEGLSVRKIAEEAGKSPSRVQQISNDADRDALDAAMAELRLSGWSAPEDPDGSDDEELHGRDLVGERLADEARWLLLCAAWVEHHDQKKWPPVVDLRPDADEPHSYNVVLYLPRIAAVMRRIAYDVDELARARTVQELDQAAIADDHRAERRRRLAEGELTFAEFHRRIRAGEVTSRYVAWRGSPRRMSEAELWRAYQHDLAERGHPDADPWGFNPFERHHRF